MKRREFIAGLGGAAAWPLAARAQQRTIPVIGVLFGGRTESFPLAVFQDGLADAGFVVGKNVAIDVRGLGADLQFAQLSEFAADLVQRHVDVIFAAGPMPIRALKSAAATIPIVFYSGGDPVKDGLVASLARPGGNVTGVTDLTTELAGKRLGLLHELVPGATTIGYLTGPAAPLPYDGVEAGARILGLDVIRGRVLADITADRALEWPFSTFAERGVGAIVVENNSELLYYERLIVSFAERYKIPTVYPTGRWVRLGGLMSYTSSPFAFNYRLLGARYVGPILKGTKPADLPVQQPTRFELVLNLKTARTLGITVPPTLIASADEVIDHEPWNIVPTITVVSAAGDPRLPLVGDAVAFWNDTFAELGTSFRLEPLTQIVGAILVHDLMMLNTNYVGLPDSLNRIGGNIIVALSEGEFISFTARRSALNKAVVAIKDYRSPPLTLPNVTQNVIAHLLGIAIGLSHNADPTTLMCGRPAPCRPNLFASDRPRYFPLTEAEKTELREMYPSSWRASR
jgi:putative tryptophan/tyrosine transport system substrate-binding protein